MCVLSNFPCKNVPEYVYCTHFSRRARKDCFQPEYAMYRVAKHPTDPMHQNAHPGSFPWLRANKGNRIRLPSVDSKLKQ